MNTITKAVIEKINESDILSAEIIEERNSKIIFPRVIESHIPNVFNPTYEKITKTLNKVATLYDEDLLAVDFYDFVFNIKERSSERALLGFSNTHKVVQFSFSSRLEEDKILSIFKSPAEEVEIFLYHTIHLPIEVPDVFEEIKKYAKQLEKQRRNSFYEFVLKFNYKKGKVNYTEDIYASLPGYKATSTILYLDDFGNEITIQVFLDFAQKGGFSYISVNSSPIAKISMLNLRKLLWVLFLLQILLLKNWRGLL